MGGGGLVSYFADEFLPTPAKDQRKELISDSHL